MGTPNVESGVATRRSQHRAIAHPPPAATPCTCAIVGLVTRSRRSSTASRRSSYCTASSGVLKFSNCAMSVPEMKAFPPAPRRMRTRRSLSRSIRSHASRSASYIVHVIALRASGRLKVRIASGPCVSNVVWVVDKDSSLKVQPWT
jgi:hypothetical protein